MSAIINTYTQPISTMSYMAQSMVVCVPIESRLLNCLFNEQRSQFTVAYLCDEYTSGTTKQWEFVIVPQYLATALILGHAFLTVFYSDQDVWAVFYKKL